MKKPLNIKKFLLPNIPYVFIALFATKLGQAWRLAPGMDFSGKALHLMEGFATAFSSLVPSFHPIDLCVGVAAALLIRLIVYVKGKNAKKFRKNLEYGSARWGRPEDIAPYVDPKFENNVILTQTERLMMSNRPKDPKTARNKNVLVVGGSGSGKTRFFIKPNLMQLHSSYVVTDPKGCIAVIRSDGFVNQNEFIAGVIINKSGGGVDLERCAADNKHIGAGYMRDCASKNIGIERFFIKHNIGFYHAAAGAVRNAAVVFYIFGIKKSVAAHTVIAMN